MSVDGFEIVETAHLKTDHSGSLTISQETNMKNSARDFMLRARRAETSARALEAILQAQAENPLSSTRRRSIDSGVDEDGVSLDGVVMTSEDYRSRLVLALQELESARAALAETKEQQKIDAENIESLQSSLERLHNLVAEYRRDKDNTDTEFTELLDLARSIVGDQSIGLSDLKNLIRSGPEGSQLAMSNAEREELETQLANWSSWSEKITHELTERDELLQEKETELAEALSKLTSLESTLREKETQLSASTNEAERKSELVDSYAAELETLKNDLQDASSLRVLLDTLQTERDLLREEVQAVKVKLDETIEKLEASQQDMLDLLSFARLTLGDDSLDIERLKDVIQSSLTGSAGNLSDAEREELEAQLAKWSDWSTEVTQELAQRDQLLNEKEVELTAANGLVAELQAEMDPLRSKLETLTAVQTQLERAEAERDLLREDVRGNQLDELIEWAQLYSDKASVDLEELKILIERGSQGLNSAASEEKLIELSERLTAKEAELTESLRQLTEYKARLSDLEITEDDQSELVPKLEAELSDLRDQLVQSAKLKDDLDRLTAERDQFRTDMDALTNIARLTTGKDSITLDDLKTMVESTGSSDESKLVELESQLANWVEWSKQVTQELADRDALLSEKEAALATSIAELEDLKAAMESRETETSHSQTENAVDDHLEELNALRTKLQAAEAEQEVFHEEVKKVRAELAEAVAKQIATGDQLAELVQVAQSVAGDDSVRVDDLKDFIRSGAEGSKSALEELHRELGHSPRTMISERDRKLEDKEAEVDELKSRLDDKDMEIEELARLVEEQKLNASQSRAEIEKLRAQVEQLTDLDVAEPSSESSELSALMELAKTVAGRDSIEVSDLRRIITDWKEKVELEKQLAHWVEWSKEMTHQLEERDQIIDKKEAELHALIFDQTQTRDAERDERLARMEAELEALKSERDELKKKEIELHAVIAERESGSSQIDAASDEISRLTTQIERLEAERDLCSEEMDELKLKLEQTEAKLKAEQSGPKPTNEERVSELETELAAKADVIADMEKKLNEWAVWADFMIAELKAKEAAVAGNEQAPQSEDIEF